MPMVSPGEVVRFECDQCSKEFEVTLEPKASNLPDEEKDKIASESVEFCPFCGEEGCVEEV